MQCTVSAPISYLGPEESVEYGVADVGQSADSAVGLMVHPRSGIACCRVRRGGMGELVY